MYSKQSMYDASPKFCKQSFEWQKEKILIWYFKLSIRHCRGNRDSPLYMMFDIALSIIISL